VALRALGRGVEIAIDAARAESLPKVAGDVFTFRGMRVLALDELSSTLVAALTEFCGVGAHDDVDAAMIALMWRRPIILHGSRSEDVVDFARTIHEHSLRKGFPFTPLDHVPSSDVEIDALCTRAGCGTIFLDLTSPLELPAPLVRHLLSNQFSDHFHLWTIAVAPDASEAARCFGLAAQLVPFCNLGFHRMPWHRGAPEVAFTER